MSVRSVVGSGVLLSLAMLAGCAPAERVTAGQNDAPQRIVAVPPSAVEMIVALGAEDRIVGVGDFVREPASLAALPRVGAYDTPNLERVLALRADLVVNTASRAATSSHQRMEALGLRVLALDTSTFEGVFRSLDELGRVLGLTERAAELAGSLRSELQQIEAAAALLPRRRVLLVVGRDPLFVAGPGSHLDELIALAGGSNVAHDALAPYASISLESALARLPEVIIDTSDNRPGAPRGAVAAGWGEWPFLPAVRESRVYWVDPQQLAIPGMRLPQMARLTARLIHPETFGQPSSDDFEATQAPDGGPRAASD